MEKNINKQELENKEQELNEKELEKVSGGQIQPNDLGTLEYVKVSDISSVPERLEMMTDLR